MIRHPLAAAAIACLLAIAGMAHATSPGPGRGSTRLEVVAAQLSLGKLDVQVLGTDATAFLDGTARGDRRGRAAGEVVGVAVGVADGGRVEFPDPPLRSETDGGNDRAGGGDVDFSVPPRDANPEDLGRDLRDEVSHWVASRRESDPSSPHAGAAAEGRAQPAHLATRVVSGEAAVTAGSQLSHLTVLGGVSEFEGVGPGDYRSWVDDHDAGSVARSFQIASATVIETGAVLDLLGVDPSTIPAPALMEMADALDVLPMIVGRLHAEGITVPIEPTALAGVLDAGPAAARDLVVGAVADAPLIAVADVSGTVSAVARVSPEGEVSTFASAGGSVGSIRVGSTEVGGFDVGDGADQWNWVEAGLRERLNEFFAIVDEDYRDLVVVRIMPRVVENVGFDEQAAHAEARMSLLELTVNPPATAPGSVTGGGGENETHLLLPQANAASGRVLLGVMDAEASHERPGVMPRCGSSCNPSDPRLDRSRRGNTDPSGPADPTDASLPVTGGAAHLGVALLLIAARRPLALLVRTTRG